jgi:large subunit ribosomal protein L13e
LGAVLPIRNEALENAVTEVSRSDLPKGEENAFRKLRLARSDARLVGVREKRAKAKAEEADSKKK